ncbi:MAG TPA: hypothetical protein VEC19_05950 [Usitatibacter sp.]|nr:hypothetical protein [Usitatibacter sp.]
MTIPRRTWPAVIAAPLLALADQSVAYALVPWACSHQGMAILHVSHAAFLVAILATLPGAWSRLDAGFPPSSPDEGMERRSFFGMVGAMMVAFSALVVLAMWIPQWFIAPCHA